MQSYEKEIKEIMTKYKDNEYMLKRIDKYMTEILPNSMHSDFKLHEAKKTRELKLLNDQSIFIQVFLIKNRLFFLPQTNTFYQYNGRDYKIIKIDDIIHSLLKSITNETELVKNKHKIKNTVIKTIKERNLLSSIPDSCTIQSVIHKLALFHENKDIVKYLLIILGDCILKKNNFIFFTSTSTKRRIIYFERQIRLYIGNVDISSYFITKYHDSHLFSKCRVLKIDREFSDDVWDNALSGDVINTICVSCHYSQRFNNSDDYLDSFDYEDECRNCILFLKEKNKSDVFDFFCNTYFYTIETGDDITVGWKEVLYIWNYFLSASGLPNIIHNSSLKTMMINHYKYDESGDVFFNISSQCLPIATIVKDFWSSVIVHTENVDDELELSELCLLLNKWLNENGRKNKVTYKLNERVLLKVIEHFYNDLQVVSNKYICKIRCSLWDKAEDIDRSLDYTKGIMSNSLNDVKCISFDDLYHYYSAFTKQENKFVVSKYFHQKYLLRHIAKEFILFKSFVAFVKITYFY